MKDFCIGVQQATGSQEKADALMDRAEWIVGNLEMYGVDATGTNVSEALYALGVPNDVEEQGNLTTFHIKGL